MSVEVGFEYNSYSPDQQMIFGKGSGNDYNSFYFYTFRSQNNVNDFVIYDKGVRQNQALGNAFSPENWYTVSFTANGSSVNAFVDGAWIKSWSNSVLFFGNNQDLLIGKCSCGGYYFNGSISFLRLYERALSRDEILQNYGSANPIREGLGLWLTLNQTSGNTLRDLSGNGNNGTVIGGVSFDSPLSS